MEQSKPAVSIIRDTHSVCPRCLQSLPARIIERGGIVYLIKNCIDHGEFEIGISSHPEDYRSLSDDYFYFMNTSMPPQEHYLCITTACNIDCPICFLKRCYEEVDGLSSEAVERAAGIEYIKKVTFSHGEPTLSPDLSRVIGMLKRRGKIVNIHTNGIKIANLDYAIFLKKAGVDHISLQFDSFSPNKKAYLRGEGGGRGDLQALDNLKKLKIPVSLNITIAKGLNEDELGAIFEYAVKERFIKDISFISYCHYGSLEDGGFSRYIMPDSLITGFSEQSRGNIKREDIICFQKLFYTYMSVFRIRKCFYYHHYVVVRGRNGYLDIAKFINLMKASAMIDGLRKRNGRLTLFFFIKVLLLSLELRSLWLFPYGVFSLFRRGYLQESGKFLVITFATICDPYKYDSAIAANCGQGIVIKDKIYDSYGTYLMQEMERKQRVL